MPVISEEHYNAGRALYEGGMTVRDIVAHADKFKDVDDENIIPSLAVGFLEGLLADIRAIREANPTPYKSPV